MPYYGCNVHNVVLVIIAGKRPDRPNNMNDELWELTQACWAAQARDRPTIWEVYNVLAAMD